MSTYKKAIAGFVGFATAVTMSFGTASAATNEELQAQITALLAQITSLQAQLGTAQTGTGTTVGAYTFAMDLTLGSTGADVLNLQKVLNSDSATQVATTGAGAPGSESTYFGAKTKAAVMKFQTKHGIAPVAGYVGPKTRAILNTLGGTTTGGNTGGVVTPVGTDVSVALSFDNPAAGTVIAGQAIADLAHFTFSNPTGTEVKVTKLVFNRTGISNDSTLVNVYLFDGAKRVTDSASVASSKITFNDPTGIFTIPAGGMKTVALRADIVSTATGQIVGIALAEVTATATVGGAFPILGNNHSIATASMAVVDFSDTTTPSGTNVAVDPQTDYTMWQNTVSFTTRAVDMKGISFRQIGSVATADLGNFKLFIDGTQVGTTVASLDANGYVNFDLTATPKRLATGSHTIKLVGDIIGGSTRTFSFSLQQASDAVFVDSQLGQPILIKKAATTFSAEDSGSHLVNAGTLTITKKTDSPTGNITLTASNALLAKYEVKAAGEPIKVENLRVGIVQSTEGTYTDYSLRNGSLFILKADGTEEQVGNTASIAGNSSATVGYTQFNLGSSLVVYPGTPVILLVRADIYNDAGTTNATAIAATETLQVRILTGSNNWKRVNSLTYDSNTTQLANELTVTAGNFTVSASSAYANRAVVKPQTAYKLASFNVVSTETEPINLDTFTMTFTGSSVGVATGLSDVYVKYGTKTTSVKSTVASTTSSYSISEVLAPNTTMPVEVWGNLTSSLATDNTIITGVTISGTTANSATARSSSATGQTLTISAGSISAAVVSDSTLATKLLVGNTQPKVASFRFTALNDTYTITDIALKASTTGNAITSLVLKSAGMADKIVFLGTANGDDSVATSSGMTLSVPANNTTGTVVDVYLNLNDIGPNAGTTGSNVRVTIDTYKAQTSAGSTETKPTDIYGNLMYVYKSIPTITLVNLPSTTLTNGTKTLSKFTIAADAAGAIGWKQIVWQVTKSAAVTLARTGVSLVDSNNNTIAGTFATSTATQAGTLMFDTDATTGYISFIATDEQPISTTETYSLKGTIAGTASNLSFGTYIDTSSSYAAADAYLDIDSAVHDGLVDFIWTDRSANSHDTTTNDWNTDYKIKNLSTDTQTMTGA